MSSVACSKVDKNESNLAEVILNVEPENEVLPDDNRTTTLDSMIPSLGLAIR